MAATHLPPTLPLSARAWPPPPRPDQLSDCELAVTTNFRRVLSEVLVRRCGNPVLGTVFPDYTGYTPLGVVSGPDLPVDGIFAVDFESQSTGA